MAEHPKGRPARAYGRASAAAFGAFGVQTYYAAGSAGVQLPGWDLLAGANRPAAAALLTAVTLLAVQLVRLRPESIVTILACALSLTLVGEHTDLIGTASTVLWAVLAAALAVEQMRGLYRVPHRRLPAWRVGILAFAGKCGASVAAGIVAMPLLLLPPGPGLDLDQHAFPMEFAARATATGVEELVLVAAVVVILRAAGRPVWEIYVAAMLARSAPHLYDLPTAVSAAMVAAVATWLYLRYGRVWPLMIAHAAGNLIAIYGGALAETALVAIGTATVVALAAVMTLKGARSETPAT